MSKLEKLPSGAEVMCAGLKTVDQIEESEPMAKMIMALINIRLQKILLMLI